MKCNEVNEMIALYIDNELNDSERRAFEEHLEACEACRQEVEELSQLVHSCSEIEEEELPEGFANDLHMKLLAAGAKESSEKKIFMFPIRKMRMISSIAAGFVVVFIAAFLLKDMVLTPSKSDNSLMDMAAGNQKSAKAEVKEALDEEKNTAEAATMADGSKLAAADNGKEDVVVQFNEAIGKDSAVEEKATGDVTLTDTLKSKDAPSTTSSGTTENTDVNSTPKLSMMAAAALPEKRLASLTIFSENMKSAGQSLEKLVLANGGERLEIESRMMSMASPEQTTGSALTFQYKIPNEQYETFKVAVQKAFAQIGIEAAPPEKQELNDTLDALTKQSNELEAKIAKAESKGVEITKEELENLKEEKATVDTELKAINSELNFTFVTVTIMKK